MDHLLQLKNVSKTFGEVSALHNVDFHVENNEIVGLLGDNGAGKSTLVKIITGYHRPDPGGEIIWKGKKIDHLSVPMARDLGIEVVYQERALADQQTLWRNIFLGREITNGWGVLDINAMTRETKKLMSTVMGFTSSAVSPESKVGTFGRRTSGGCHYTRPVLRGGAHYPG